MTVKLLIGTKQQLLTFFYGMTNKAEEDIQLKKYVISRICIATDSLQQINVDINSIRYCIHFADIQQLIVINKVKSKLKQIQSNVKKAKNDVIYNILQQTKWSSPIRQYNSIMSNDFTPIVQEVEKEEQYKNDLKNDIDVYYSSEIQESASSLKQKFDSISNVHVNNIQAVSDLVQQTHQSILLGLKAKDAYGEKHMQGSPLVDILKQLKAIQKRLSNLQSSKTQQVKPLKLVQV